MKEILIKGLIEDGFAIKRSGDSIILKKCQLLGLYTGDDLIQEYLEDSLDGDETIDNSYEENYESYEEAEDELDKLYEDDYCEESQLYNDDNSYYDDYESIRHFKGEFGWSEYLGCDNSELDEAMELYADSLDK